LLSCKIGYILECILSIEDASSFNKFYLKIICIVLYKLFKQYFLFNILFYNYIFVLITGRYKKKNQDDGLISMQFIQKYLIPEQCDPNEITSTLSSDGVLMIIVPKKTRNARERRDIGERIIDIQHTGKPAEYRAVMHTFKLHK